MREDIQSPASKETLRRELKTLLAAQDAEAARRAALRATARLLSLPELRDAAGILTCLSFGPELDTWGLVERLLADGRRVYVPRAARRDRRLHVHRYPCALETLEIGLRQPPRTAPELAADEIDGAVDAAIVLGLGFDRRGYRLGYGGGYFDRFLAGRRFPAIGLGYGFQLVDKLPHEAHDVAMTAVVTDDAVVRPGRSETSR